MGLSRTVAVFFWVTSGVYLFTGAFFVWYLVEWNSLTASRYHTAAELQTLADVEEAAYTLVPFAMLSYFVTGVLFIVWFFQAYKSAESRGATHRKWGAGWTIGGWFIPAALFVIPKLVMNQVDRMSNPATGQPPIGERWRGQPRLASSDWWWGLFLAGFFLLTGGNRWLSDLTISDSSVTTGIAALTAGYAVMAASGIAAGKMVTTIGNRLRWPEGHTAQELPTIRGSIKAAKPDEVTGSRHGSDAVTVEEIGARHRTLTPGDPIGAAQRAHEERLSHARQLHSDGRYTDLQLAQFATASEAERDRDIAAAKRNQ